LGAEIKSLEPSLVAVIPAPHFRPVIILAHSVVALFLFSPLNASNAATPNQAVQIRILVRDYFQQDGLIFPQRARSRGDPTPAAFEENRPAERKLWLDRQTRLLAKLDKIDERAVRGTEEWIVYGVLREVLESSLAREHACGYYHLRVSHVLGLSDQLEMSVKTQPLGSPELRRAAIAEWSRLPGYLQIEATGLRDELDHRYSAPKSIVRLVIAHLDEILSSDESRSPYFDPVRKAQDAGFTGEWRATYRRFIEPALQGYRNFLAREYLARARESISISALPDGKQCYEALFRSYTTVSLPGAEVFQLGQRTARENRDEMTHLALRLYGDADIAYAMRRLDDDPDSHFSNGQELLDFSRVTVDRAHIMAANWFSVLPGELLVRPYPADLDRPGAPATFQLLRDHQTGLFQVPILTALQVTKARAEITAAHEGIPGHHIERSIASRSRDEHLKVLQSQNLAYIEGWARYAEGLAEEMNLYTQKASPILRRSYIGHSMVVDAGLHLRNWTRQQALAYMLESGYFLKDEAEAVLDRVVALPARLTAYDYGALQFLNLRNNAESAMGNCFDIRDFHRLVLEHGPVPFWMLRTLISDKCSPAPPNRCEQVPR
jgi:uncharacterized protein (DUF885 family)